MSSGVGGGAAGCALSTFASNRESATQISHRRIVLPAQQVVLLGNFRSGTRLDTEFHGGLYQCVNSSRHSSSQPSARRVPPRSHRPARQTKPRKPGKRQRKRAKTPSMPPSTPAKRRLKPQRRERRRPLPQRRTLFSVHTPALTERPTRRRSKPTRARTTG